MPWTQIDSFTQLPGTYRVSTGLFNAGQYIAIHHTGILPDTVTPWGVLYIGAALPAVANNIPVIASILLYKPFHCYLGPTGIGNNANIATYLNKTGPVVNPLIRLYRFT